MVLVVEVPHTDTIIQGSPNILGMVAGAQFFGPCPLWLAGAQFLCFYPLIVAVPR